MADIDTARARVEWLVRQLEALAFNGDQCPGQQIAMAGLLFSCADELARVTSRSHSDGALRVTLWRFAFDMRERAKAAAWSPMPPVMIQAMADALRSLVVAARADDVTPVASRDGAA